tara:strand:+ start:1608 stop:2150 length:543 start_codon:yes stop_codon:yes gene_type:complete
MKTKLLMSTVLLITFFEVSAQKIYRTNDGHIEMMTLIDGKPIKAESHNLALYLDYDTKVVNGVLDLKTFVTDLPELNTIIKEGEAPAILRFTGTIPSVDFLSNRHDPINFNWLVDVTYQGKIYKSQFKATITHIEQGISMSCLLSARGQVLVSNTGLDSLIEGLDKTMEVQFAQLVLKLD